MTVNASIEQAGGVAVLDGKVALVTGATSGIGEACAVALGLAGAYVVATGRDAERGAATVKQIVAGNGKAHFTRLDVTVEDDWKRAVADIDKQFGRLDILINNAGRGVRGPVETIPMEGNWFEIHLNIEGAFLGMTYAWPMLKRRGGVVMNMNSTAGQHGGSGSIAYGGSKGGMLGLTKSAAAEGKRFGIRVISIHPGSTWTPGMKALSGDTEEAYFERFKDGSSIPVGIPARPSDIAVPVVFLASDAARHITGIEFNIDGGQSAR